MRNDKISVTSALMYEWAEGTLGEWLPGYTNDDNGIQYKIVHIGPQHYQVQPADWADRSEARVFTVNVVVTEQH